MTLRHQWRGFIFVMTTLLCLTAFVATASKAEDERQALVGSKAFSQAPTRPRTVTPTSGPVPDLGPGASLHGKQVFPPDNPWNQDISRMPVDPNSANLIAAIGRDDPLHPDFGPLYHGAPNGIPYIVVAGTQPLVPVVFTAYGAESDPGPYPVPRNAPVEGGSGS